MKVQGRPRWRSGLRLSSNFIVGSLELYSYRPASVIEWSGGKLIGCIDVIQHPMQTVMNGILKSTTIQQLCDCRGALERSCWDSRGRCVPWHVCLGKGVLAAKPNLVAQGSAQVLVLRSC